MLDRIRAIARLNYLSAGALVWPPSMPTACRLERRERIGQTEEASQACEDRVWRLYAGHFSCQDHQPGGSAQSSTSPGCEESAVTSHAVSAEAHQAQPAATQQLAIQTHS